MKKKIIRLFVFAAIFAMWLSIFDLWAVDLLLIFKCVFGYALASEISKGLVE